MGRPKRAGNIHTPLEITGKPVSSRYTLKDLSQNLQRPFMFGLIFNVVVLKYSTLLIAINLKNNFGIANKKVLLFNFIPPHYCRTVNKLSCDYTFLIPNLKHLLRNKTRLFTKKTHIVYLLE